MLVPNDYKPAAGLAVFTDETLVESLRQLVPVLTQWEWVAVTDSPYEYSREEIAEQLLEKLKAAAEAAAAAGTTTTTTKERT
jgi:nucleotide-binding universal stress UspA family protein